MQVFLVGMIDEIGYCQGRVRAISEYHARLVVEEDGFKVISVRLETAVHSE
jgi:hypothetical protein